jgi:hypothetical protein
MRITQLAALLAALAGGPAAAGDVGVVKGPGWWGPVYGVGTTGVDAVQSTGGVVRGGPAAEAAAGGAVAAARPDGRLAAVVPAGADRATLLRLRQALAEEAARRGLR